MENIHKYSGKQLHKALLEKKITAEQIAKTYLSRAKEFSDLNAFIETYEDSMLKKAKQIDEKIKEGKPVGKLAGIPIAIKDNIHISGKITTCGSKFLENYKAPFSAAVSELLDQADAMIIGKTNLDEFAMGSSTENSAFFPSKNPWNIKCSPGGSSGGSATAVAARLCSIALGSDTGGSIRQPASFTGTFGFKPTYGRVSRYGLVAFASSLDQIGPMANFAEDIGLVMEVIGRPCDKDSTSHELPAENYFANNTESLEGKTIGVPFKFLENLDGEAKKQFEKNLERLKELKANIVDINLDVLKHSVSVYYIIATAEASTNLARFDGIRYGHRSEKASSLDDIYDFSRDEGFGKEVKTRILLGTYVLSAGYKAHLYQKAQKVRQMVVNSFNKAFETCHLIAMPSAPTGAFEIGAIQDPLKLYIQDIFTIGANLAGLPAISVPSGMEEGNKPLGLQLVGPQLHDVNVVESAAVFTSKASIPPNYDKEVNV